MKHIFLILGIVAVSLSGCYKDDNEGVITGSATLNGTNVVPSVVTTGTATINYAYNPNTRIFTYQVDFANLTDSCTQIGISKASAGQVLPASTYQLFNFNAPITLQRRKTGTFTGQFVVEQNQMILSELRAGLYCVYVRSKAFFTAPTAELRAQISF